MHVNGRANEVDHPLGYVRIVRRRKWVVLVTVAALITAASLFAFLQTPTYTATAEVLLQPPQNFSLTSAGVTQPLSPSDVQTQVQLLTSAPVKAAVAKDLGAAPPVMVSPVGQTNVIEVQAGNENPRRAARTANAYANAYAAFRQSQALSSLTTAANQLQIKVNILDGQIKDITSRLSAASVRDQASLMAQRDSLLTQDTSLKTQLSQIQLAVSANDGGAQLVTPATSPTSPSSPRPARDVLIALVVGLLLGVSLAFLREYLDDSIRTKEDLELATPGTPALGLIPVVADWKDHTAATVVSLAEPSSAAAEAYRTLRTSIQYVGLDRPVSTLQVTSAAAFEGKSTTLANLAVALANAGQDVVVVCCDLRRPRLHDFFGVKNDVGFTSVLLGEAPLFSALQDVPGTDHLQILPSGPIPSDPSELLSGQRTVEILTVLASEADIVLIDSPPVLPVTDAAVLSTRIDAVLVLAAAGRTKRRDLARATELLRQVDAPVMARYSTEWPREERTATATLLPPPAGTVRAPDDVGRRQLLNAEREPLAILVMHTAPAALAGHDGG